MHCSYHEKNDGTWHKLVSKPSETVAKSCCCSLCELWTRLQVNGITTTLARNDAGQVLKESYSGGILNGLSVTNGYDDYLRRANLVVLSGSSPLSTTAYGYGNASRLAVVTSGSYNANFSYLANSPLVEQITLKNNSTTRMTTTKQYDNLNRLQGISSSGSQLLTPISFNYSYNDANQRTRVNLDDGSFWIYEYDALGQVRSGKRYWSDWTPVAGQQFEYGFDDIGNRASTKSGGDDVGSSLRLATYTVNSLNQYTQRTVPGYVDIKGLALANNSVTVNSQTPYRRGEYFRKELSVGNGSASVWQGITVAAPTETSVTGNIYVPETPEAFAYDLDGNLTQDGRWIYTWDGENRLIRMVASTANGPQQLIQFEYDWKGRRIHKQVWNNTAGTGSPALDLRYLYDAWNLMAEIDSSEEWVRQYMWGLDLSGTMQGAGGVGGLVKVFERAGATHSFVGYDGNGNVSLLVNGANGNVTARYEYGPFGESIRVTGAIAKSNPFRFSTKYQDDESDLIYYGYRYYNQSTGRWLSRDPIEEVGGLNLFGFVRNNPFKYVDTDGRGMFSLPSGGINSPSIFLPPNESYQPESVAGAYVSGFMEGLTQLFRNQNYRDCYVICAFDSGINSLLNPTPFEFRPFQGMGGYGSGGFFDSGSLPGGAGMVSDFVGDYYDSVNAAQGGAHKIERLKDLLGRTCTAKRSPEKLRKLQQQLDDLSHSQSLGKNLKSAGKALAFLDAWIGFAECYNKHCGQYCCTTE